MQTFEESRNEMRSFCENMETILNTKPVHVKKIIDKCKAEGLTKEQTNEVLRFAMQKADEIRAKKGA